MIKCRQERVPDGAREMVCKAHVAGLSAEIQNELNFKWTIRLSFDGYDLIREKTVTGPIECPFNNDVWNGEFGGGYATITVTVKYNDKDITSQLVPADSVKVLGTNPTTNDVLNYIEDISDDADIVQCTRGCARMETDAFYQFKPETRFPFAEIKRDGSIGEGRGLMQLTFSTFINSNTLWNWKRNISEGAGNIQFLKRLSRNWFQSNCSGYDPSEEELHKDIYRLYNKGTGINDHYYTFINDKEPWFFRNIAFANDCGHGCAPRFEHAAHPPNTPAGKCINSGCCYADITYGRED